MAQRLGLGQVGFASADGLFGPLPVLDIDTRRIPIGDLSQLGT
jgi:hypothetical protein